MKKLHDPLAPIDWLAKFRKATEKGCAVQHKKQRLDVFSMSWVIQVFDSLSSKKQKAFLEQTKNDPALMIATAWKLHSKAKEGKA
ncbi:hypothetical protein [Sulfidibacter corallicola]|uniref:Uncharacterized protein n=1 Tax=Sulfidibacter corallicola TaxID=2818388 RepID=A0A8A4TMB8_SULCO|nr:hypothetical protein [Sulfidibacter corallicola]QTD50700.1 hypothetical protein J3U87_34370 [Sulfidibacter corallicola]